MVWEGMKRMMALDSLFGRRWKLSCFIWFLLLFGVGGVLFFIQLQNTPGTVPRQGYGILLRGTLQQSRETFWTQDKERGKSNIYQEHQAADSVLPWEQDTGSQSVSKLLTTSRPNQCINNNTSTSSGWSSLQRWRELCSIQAQRKQLMKKMCGQYKGNIFKTITQDHVKNIFVEDKYKILYCQVPKVGCSNWKRTLMVLGGQASDPQNIPHEVAHSGRLKTLDSFRNQGIKRRLKTYTKVIFVREPFERLVSAYRDKFENPNSYYHSFFGKPIISKYRVNASRAALDSGNGVTFQEFVQYLLDVHRPVGMDVHWEVANQLCHPCHIDYDFIGKFENMDDESNFVLRLVGAPPKVALPTFKDRNPADKKTSWEITQKYFAQISTTQKQRVYDLYYKDYLMFNYSKPFQDLY